MKDEYMKSGRKLDARIAKEIFGYEVVENKKGGWSIGPADYYDVAGEMVLFNPLPSYSEEISDTWKIVDHMQGVWDIKSMHDSWYVRLAVASSPWAEKFVDAEATTINVAICLAALLAVSVN